jgi:hypothetical protein
MSANGRLPLAIGRNLMVSCYSCRGNVQLKYGGVGPYRWQPWVCPHCTVRNGLNLSGLILGVKKPARES